MRLNLHIWGPAANENRGKNGAGTDPGKPQMELFKNELKTQGTQAKSHLKIPNKKTASKLKRLSYLREIRQA